MFRFIKPDGHRIKVYTNMEPEDYQWSKNEMTISNNDIAFLLNMIEVMDIEPHDTLLVANLKNELLKEIRRRSPVKDIV